MAKNDRTFTDKAILRIIKNNLDPEEQERVIIQLCEGVTIEDFGQGPIIVPLSSEEEAVVDIEFVDIIVDVVIAFLGSGLPSFLRKLLFSVNNTEGLRTLIKREALKR